MLKIRMDIGFQSMPLSKYLPGAKWRWPQALDIRRLSASRSGLPDPGQLQNSTAVPELYLILARTLGSVHRHVRALRQFFDAFRVLGIDGNSDTA